MKFLFTALIIMSTMGCASLPLPSPDLVDYFPTSMVGKSPSEVYAAIGHPDELGDTCSVPVNDPKNLKVNRLIGSAWYYETKTSQYSTLRSLCLVDGVVISERDQYITESGLKVVSKEFQFTDHELVNKLAQKRADEMEITIKPAPEPGVAPQDHFPGQGGKSL